MALKLNKSQFGVLIDYFGAQRDVKEKAIRVLHSLSFVEDPTRCLRAVRFEQRFGFKIGKQTRNLITNAIKRNAFAHVNPRRLWLELTHILEEPNPVKILSRLHELGLWKAIHPALAFTDEVEQRFYHVRTVLSWFDLLYLEARYARWLVFFLALTDHLRERDLHQVLDQLAVSEKHRSIIHESRVWSGRILRSLERRPGMRPSSLVYLFDKAPLEGQLWTMAKGEGDQVRRAFSAYFTEYKRVTLLINGHDLQQLGFKPGPIFSRILKAVREARLNGWVKTLEDEIDFIFRRFGQQRKI
jgi:tRNA nucleotidyltransferase (CCA-adding enzyme)